MKYFISSLLLVWLWNQFKGPSQHNLLFPRGCRQLELIVTIDKQGSIAKDRGLIP